MLVHILGIAELPLKKASTSHTARRGDVACVAAPSLISSLHCACVCVCVCNVSGKKEFPLAGL